MMGFVVHRLTFVALKGFCLFQMFQRHFLLCVGCVSAVRTHIHHGDFLWAWARVVRPIGQHPVGLFHTLVLVLVQVAVHLLPLLPVDTHAQTHQGEMSISHGERSRLLVKGFELVSSAYLVLQ